MQRADLFDFKAQQVGVCRSPPPFFGFRFCRHAPRQLRFGGALPSRRSFDEVVALSLGVARRLPLLGLWGSGMVLKKKEYTKTQGVCIVTSEMRVQRRNRGK
jgi:hypothetical protein